MAEHVQVKISVLGLLMQDDKILLQRRYNTGWEDGNYTIPSGRMEQGELPKAALVRELKEEIGVEVSESDLEFLYVDYVQDKAVNFIFKVTKWQGEPRIMEPDKCDELKWVSLNDVPENVIGRGKQILADINNKVPFAEYRDF